MPKHTRNATRLATITTMAAAATLALAACGQSAAQPASGGETGAAKDTIVVAAVPAEESANLHAQFDGINKELEKATGKKVTFQQATDYAAIIEGQRAGKNDLAMYGPFSYVIARDGGVPVEPVGALIAEKAASPATTRWAGSRPTPPSPISGASRARRCASSTRRRPRATSTPAPDCSRPGSTRRRASLRSWPAATTR